jgi:hypothetical protein
VTANKPVPAITAPASGESVYRATAYVVQGEAADGNLVTSVPCASLRWKSSVAGEPIDGQTGCQVSTQFISVGPRTLTLTATNSLGYQATKSVTFTVVDPPPKTPPVVTITSPLGTASSPFYVSNPGAALQLVAKVTDPGGFPVCPTGSPSCVSYAWKALKSGTWQTLGTSATLSFTPTSVFPSNCGGYSVQLQFCATDPNGTACKDTFLYLYFPVC